MSVAQEALHYVLKIHAGFLQSYEMDERKRMLRSYRIVRETDNDMEDSNYPIGHSEHHVVYTMSDEALENLEAKVLHLIQESTEILLRIAPNYVTTPMRQIPNNLDAAEATLAAFRKELEIRMANTQQDRVRQAIEMIDEFYASDIYDMASWTSACYEIKCKLQDRIQYTLHDINWVRAESDEHIMDWLLATWHRFRRMEV